jgi:transcriptional regulator with XRE-family HTH domain
MARRIDDLDVRDYDTRTAVRVRLRERREQLGVTQRALGEALGFEAANVRRLERAGVDQSYTVTVMRWAAALGLRLVLEPVGFPPPVGLGRVDTLNDMMAALTDAGFAGDEEWEVARIIADLAGIRAACRVACAQLAAKIGVTPTAVGLIETAGASSALVVLQRHARGIARCARRPDAYLAVRLEEATALM